MSKKMLDSLLAEAIEIMETNIRRELNLQEQRALFTPARIREAILNQLRFTYATGEKKYEAWQLLTPAQRKEFIELIKVRSVELNAELKGIYEDLQVPGVTIRVSGSEKRFTVYALVTDESALKRYGRFQESAFSAVRKGYSKVLNEVWAGIGWYLEQETGYLSADFQEGAFDLEHALGQSVAEKQVSAGITSLYNSVKSQVGSDSAAKEVFDQLGLDVWLDFVSTDDMTSAKLYVGSKSKNRSKSSAEKAILAEAKTALSDALSTYMVKDVKAWRGSDDRIEIEKKKVVESFNNSIKLKTKSISTKRELTKTTTKKKPAKLKVKTTEKKAKKIPLATKSKVLSTRKKKRQTTANNLISLGALINQKLPETVAKNMKLPGLQYRTGRFARSVRVTEVTQTTQGFPSIGYTYQRNPYQTFEPGGKQGSTDRDPRKVIDKSIREIALGLLVGRFYTRRV